MEEHPILFTGDDMVRAILDGCKTQTRRIIKRRKLHPDYGEPQWDEAFVDGTPPEPYLHVPFGIDANRTVHRHYPKYQVGDTLWVREAWCYAAMSGYDAREDGGEIWYRASDAGMCEGPWKSPYHLFRKYARIFLEITNIRVERVQDISEDDAEAEGTICDRTYREDFKNLWDSINAKRGFGWAKNPFTWCISFKVIK